MWSFARQQKYNFCPRAFYFRFKEIPDHFSEDLSSELSHFRHLSLLNTSSTFFTVNLAKELFYSRIESDYALKKLIHREGRKLSLTEEKLTITFENLKNFIASDFYQSTNPSLVNHVMIEEIPTINIGEQEVTGAVHVAWNDYKGKHFSVRMSPKGADVNTAFAALYPLKKFHVEAENINVGALSTVNWQCTWKSLDWHEISEMQDLALSFEEAGEFTNYPPTEKISHCEFCDFSEICYRYSSELDLT